MKAPEMVSSKVSQGQVLHAAGLWVLKRTQLCNSLVNKVHWNQEEKPLPLTEFLRCPQLTKLNSAPAGVAEKFTVHLHDNTAGR